MKLQEQFGGVWCHGVASGTCWPAAARRNGGGSRAADAVAQGFVEVLHGMLRMFGDCCMCVLVTVELLWDGRKRRR